MGYKNPFLRGIAESPKRTPPGQPVKQHMPKYQGPKQAKKLSGQRKGYNV
jgi:hypothetical protein